MLAGASRARPAGHGIFWRAERRPDRTRACRLIEGDPLSASHGKDSCERIFAVHARDFRRVRKASEIMKRFPRMAHFQE